MDPEGVSGGLVERGEELRALHRSLEQARLGGGQFVVVEGPAGIGKTSLLDACVERGVGLGLTVLRARGDEVAMESPFSAVRELLWPGVSNSRVSSLAGAAQFAAPVFEVVADEGETRDRVGAVLHGLYWLVANLADRRPLLLILDDAHWIDPASARFLLYLARRIESLPVFLLAAARPGEGADPIGVVPALSAVADTILRPSPLSELGAGVLVRRELGPRADDELCRSCREATGGNPFYLQALTAALRSEGGRPTVELARKVRALGTGALGRSLLVRLARLGQECERLAQAVAVLGPDSPLRHAAALAGVGRERAEAAADQLRRVELLAPGEGLSFMHPIVQEAVAAELAPSSRASQHRQAAALLVAETAPLDRVATHLLAAEAYGEAWVVIALRGAAREALARGAPEAAVVYLRRALAEPPAAELRLDVLLELGRAEAQLPYGHDLSAYREALESARGPQQRAEIALELAWGLTAMGRNADVAELLTGVLDRTDELDPALVERIEGLLIGAGAVDLTMTKPVLAIAARHFDRFERGESFDAVAVAPALAWTGAVTGLPAAAATELARRAHRDPRILDFSPAYLGGSMALFVSDHLEEARDALDAGLAEAQRRGSVPMFVQMSEFRAGVALRMGDLDVAEDHAQRAFELGGELGLKHWPMTYLLPILLERGRAEEALRVIATLPLGEPELRLWPGVMVLAHRGCAHVVRGDPRAGVADLLDADRRMAGGRCDLSVCIDWVATAAPALAALGREDEARALTARELAAARAFGAPRRYGVALSACGLVDPDPLGLERLREAVALLGGTPARLDHARALVNLGARLRERGESAEARTVLARGMDIAHGCGAFALAERAREESVAAGARPRREALSGPGALTPAELRTARMATEGLTNREIAQALFVSTKTVETHLSHAYAKLGIERRAELSAALAAADGAAAVLA
ncbi:MAG: AAA family ATPase [Solirubrobacteraceae bacterium]